jgi:hypothetical protein
VVHRTGALHPAGIVFDRATGDHNIHKSRADTIIHSGIYSGTAVNARRENHW